MFTSRVGAGGQWCSFGIGLWIRCGCYVRDISLHAVITRRGVRVHFVNTTGSAVFAHAWGFVSRKPLATPLLQAMWAGGTQSAKVCAVHTNMIR